MPLTGLKFENDQLKVEPPRTVNIFEILPIAGLLVQKHAEANAIPYYKEIVDIMKRGIPKIFQTNLNERI